MVVQPSSQPFDPSVSDLSASRGRPEHVDQAASVWQDQRCSRRGERQYIGHAVEKHRRFALTRVAMVLSASKAVQQVSKFRQAKIISMQIYLQIHSRGVLPKTLFRFSNTPKSYRLMVAGISCTLGACFWLLYEFASSGI